MKFLYSINKIMTSLCLNPFFGFPLLLESNSSSVFALTWPFLTTHHQHITLCVVHYSPATLTFCCFLECFKLFGTWGLLYLLFSLPGTLFLLFFPALVIIPHIYSLYATFSERYTMASHISIFTVLSLITSYLINISLTVVITICSYLIYLFPCLWHISSTRI